MAFFIWPDSDICDLMDVSYGSNKNYTEKSTFYQGDLEKSDFYQVT